MPSRPSPAGPAAATMQGPTGSSASAAAPVSATAFGILAAPESSLRDVSSGPHRDGRIRNPVPSKLKGKTDGSKGNFSVMHMEVVGKIAATDRDAAAKRTSENTELAAKRAFENGYVSLRRSRFIHLPDEPVAKPFVPTPTPGPTSGTAPIPAAPPPASVQFQHRSPLGPEETKSEQARLLTLLQSLHPALVVDQICKALTFFGGIPGAPPPAHEGFPESAEANGPGSLFVGWIAEIFPRLGGNSVQQRVDHTRQLDVPPTVKRKRGRPKGSKATKARKDKGIKKGPKPVLNAGRSQPSDAPDGSWVDVDDGHTMAATDNVDANIMLLTQATTGPQPQGGTARTALPTAGGTTTGPTPIARKRGRPKGSRNRPKVSASSSAERVGQMPQVGTHGHHPSAQSPQVLQPTQAAQVMGDSAAQQSFTAVNTPLPTKKKGGRPRDLRPNQSAQGQHRQISLGSEQQGATGPSGPTDPTVPAQVQAEIHQAPQTVQPIQSSQGQTLTPQTASLAVTKPATNAGQKRKRNGERDALLSHANDQNNQLVSSAEENGHVLQTPPNNLRSPPQPLAAPEPVPKRLRKGKEPKPSAKKGDERVVNPITGGPNTTSAEPLSPKSAPNPTPNPDRAPSPPAARPRSMLVSDRIVESPTGSVHSPQPSHFEVQSPTMENYEAQLQAQLEQQTHVEPQPLASQSGPDSTLPVSSRLPQQQHQRHQQQQQQQQQQQNQSRSSNPQPQSAKSQLDSSPLITQQARPSQTQYNQYRASSSQYQHQQPQPSYVSSQTEQPQHHQQQFSGGQQHAQGAQVSAAQQYSTSTSQPQQYSSNQQTYGSNQEQYPGGQQLASQQRYQHQLATTSAGTASYTTHQSPQQFSTSASNSFNPSDPNYRSPATSLNSTSYGQRSQSVTPSAASFRATSTHSLPQHSPPFGTAATALHQRSASTSQPTTQNMQGLAGVQPFTGEPGTGWGLFDTSHLTDASGQQATMGLGNANYGINAATVRAPSNNNNSAFAAAAAAGLATFDASGLGSNDRYYGVGRR
ncbi:hypothetical protein BT67DRAFT_391010 [Trichocladium antarcticum]|uniref:Uncharacterized protein n=1 Tax=Trichocladium antarcticum TaxID=1450529 RepID=A0AAN6UCE4_9PEZI|nr:hypothetical protein BT67DRAFT_391010 [Trichocladium antarcticum]